MKSERGNIHDVHATGRTNALTPEVRYDNSVILMDPTFNFELHGDCDEIHFCSHCEVQLSGWLYISISGTLWDNHLNIYLTGFNCPNLIMIYLIIVSKYFVYRCSEIKGTINVYSKINFKENLQIRIKSNFCVLISRVTCYLFCCMCKHILQVGDVCVFLRFAKT